MKVIINEQECTLIPEDNETAAALLKLLPLDLNMRELNGNEKYANLDASLPTASYHPDRIEAGDVMLFGNNCLVIFYKSFATTYSYTRIGRINDLPELGKDNVRVRLEK